MRRQGRPGRPAGFTLVELVVVVLIIGILSAVMLPQYNRTVESSKADDASSVVTMIGQANRMYFLDNSAYADGNLSDACNGQCCPPCANPAAGACLLVACHYLGARQWSNLSYTYSSGPAACTGGNRVGCATRSNVGNPAAPYSGWGYFMDNTGIVTAVGGAPTPQK